MLAAHCMAVEKKEGRQGSMHRAPTNWDLHVSHDPLRQAQREGLGPQPRHSLHHLVPEAKQRLGVLQRAEIGGWHCQDDVVRSQLSPGTWILLDAPLPLLLGGLPWEESPWGLKLTFLNPLCWNIPLEPQEENTEVMSDHIPPFILLLGSLQECGLVYISLAQCWIEGNLASFPLPTQSFSLPIPNSPDDLLTQFSHSPGVHPMAPTHPACSTGHARPPSQWWAQSPVCCSEARWYRAGRPRGRWLTWWVCPSSTG